MISKKIKQFLKEEGIPSYRFKQFNKAYYQNFLSSFDEITTWPEDLRDKISNNKELLFSRLELVKLLKSDNGGTLKAIFKRKNNDQDYLETVLMRHRDGRNTVCVSSMIGCPLACAFCATGKMGFISNLKADEIIDQILYFARFLKKDDEKISNIVYMGMGEPLLNFKEVWKSIDIITDPKKMHMSQRRVAISTAGIVRGIRKLLKNNYKGRLAISLHAPTQKLRKKIMPKASHNHLTDLLKIIDQYIQKTNKRVSFEYILIDGVNDQVEHAQKLVKICKNRLVHVNLIPYNPVPGDNFKKSSQKAIYNFSHILEKENIPHTIRVTMGAEIDAACGQLNVSKYINQDKKEII